MTLKNGLAELCDMWDRLPAILGDDHDRMRAAVEKIVEELRRADGDAERAALVARLLRLFRPYPVVARRLEEEVEKDPERGAGRAGREPSWDHAVEELLRVVDAVGTGSLGLRAEPASPSPVPDAPEYTIVAGDTQIGTLHHNAPPGEAAPTSASDEEPGPGVPHDPPRTAFALLACDDVVVAETPFELRVGLSESQVPGLAGQPIVRPPTTVGSYVLTVQVVADGFSLADAHESFRLHLPVTVEDPYPAAVLHLTANPQQPSVQALQIQAHFSIDGHPVGWAVRAVAVVSRDDLRAKTPAPERPSGVSVSIPTGENPPDLTVVISIGSDGGRLLWTFVSPHDIAVPEEEIATKIGDEPAAFAEQLMRDVNAREGRDGLYEILLGNARDIARACPDELFDLLVKATFKSTRSRPTVLILSAEPYIPWELAAVQDAEERPLIDPDSPPFLGAQAVVGRWVLFDDFSNLPPPETVSVSAIAAISGKYDKPRWKRLEAAEQEAAEISARYGAAPVDAETTAVLRCLRGEPAAQVLHFAVHGIFDPDSVQNGLVLIDESTLAPAQVRAYNMRHKPFVFLNACQVGQGNRVLGDYAGLSASFLAAGASGVVSPLWSVKDTVAKEIALRFYERVFAGETVAAALREERAKLGSADNVVSATPLAYQFFGHPDMKLSKTNL